VNLAMPDPVLAAVIVVAVAAVLGVAQRPAARAAPTRIAGIACGVERWDVKTLTDRSARLVNPRPRPTTIRALTRLTPPRFSLVAARGHGVERMTYRIHVRVIAAHREADQDYHLIVADPHRAAPTMIVEFPDPTCTFGASPPARRMMRRARSAFLAACGGAGNLAGTATITGVGFFDLPHATGAAANGIELHPVLGFVSQNCA
jgi:hypothetical protein